MSQQLVPLFLLLLLLLLLLLFSPSGILCDSQYTGLVSGLAALEEEVDLKLAAIGERVAVLEGKAEAEVEAEGRQGDDATAAADGIEGGGGGDEAADAPSKPGE